MAEIVYSCVIDRGAKFQHQARILLETLHRNAGVGYGRIYAHVTSQDLEICDWLRGKGVRVIPVARFGDGKYCNKIAQVDSARWFEGDYVFLLDCDLAFRASIEPAVDGYARSVLGKPVDFPNPPIDLLEKALALAAIPDPGRTTTNLLGASTLRGNFNGGVLGLPVARLESFGELWKKWALHMLRSKDAVVSLGRFGVHVDQVSLAIALRESRLPYSHLALGENCPTHIWLPQEGVEITELPKVLHFHDNFNENGLLGYCGVGILDYAIDRINASIADLSDHPLYLQHKGGGPRRPPIHVRCLGTHSVTEMNVQALHGLLRSAGIESAKSVLEYRCGSGAHLEGLALQEYRGIDPRRAMVALGRRREGSLSFTEGDLQMVIGRQADLVLCLDLLGAVETGQPIGEVVNVLGRSALQRVVLAGPNKPWDMLDRGGEADQCLQRVMQDSGLFTHIVWLGRHAGMDVLVGERTAQPTSSTPSARNQMPAAQLAQAIATSRWPELLVECVLVSRSVFGWYTKHLPRIFEYPWVLDRLGPSLQGQRIGDFGAGLSNLPLSLANRGATVATVDAHKRVVTRASARHANEWGFFDYAAVHGSTESKNEELAAGSFPHRSFDVLYSVSVIEHMPAQERRALLDLFAVMLKPRGKLLLTVDLHKRSRDLWDLVEGKVVEPQELHGTMGSVLSELEGRGFTITYTEFIPLPYRERVDLGLIEAVYAGQPERADREVVLRDRRHWARETLRLFKASRVAAPLRRPYRLARAVVGRLRPRRMFRREDGR
jgi:2-polyprenyl-3-methyl-5-hydroxy-6-metoxy-1,4-benzoquinol methylase